MTDRRPSSVKDEALNEIARQVADHCAQFVDDIGNCLVCELQNEMGDHEDFCPVGMYMRIRGTTQ